jgi:hypothetical protein
VKRPIGADLESRMTILVERINKGERVLEKAQQAESATERWETYVREKSSLETKIGLLDRLTGFFGPNGATMRQSSGRMGSFTEDLNRNLAAFGYCCSIVLEPFEIRVISSNDDRLGFSLKHLSESERFRFSVAFRIALAIVTGLRIVVIDRAEHRWAHFCGGGGHDRSRLRRQVRDFAVPRSAVFLALSLERVSTSASH